MEPFKNLFSPELVRCFGRHLQTHLPGFERATFESAILMQLDKFELKDRAQLIADHIHEALPSEQSTRNKILLALLHPEELDNEGQSSDENGIRGWGIFPLTMVVGQHAAVADFDNAMTLLRR